MTSTEQQSEQAVTQFLTFCLDSGEYGVEVEKVREVLEYTKVTKVPRTPDFMRGVINLRGSVVPVLDLRLKFGMPEVEQTVYTCIIVLEVESEDNETVILGAIADAVNEVIDLDKSMIEPPPRIGDEVDAEFISGMGKREEEFIIILDIDRVFTLKEIKKVSEHMQAAPGE